MSDAATFSGVNVTMAILNMKQPDFGWFAQGGGHFSVGGALGQMGDMQTSPAGGL